MIYLKFSCVCLHVSLYVSRLSFKYTTHTYTHTHTHTHTHALTHTHTQNTVTSAPSKALSAVKNIQGSTSMKLPTGNLKLPSFKLH